MISDIDETIREILIKEGGFDTGEVDISFEIPTREWSGSISKPTLNCYLFDIRENIERRQYGMRTDGANPSGTVRRRPPTYFDLTYVITAWTRVVEDEHRLLWHVLTTLKRFSTLPTEHLQGVLMEQQTEINVQTAHPESLIKNPNDFWGALDNQLRPALSFVVTIAYDRPFGPVGPPVLSTMVRIQQRGTDAPAEAFLWIGGTVQDEQKQPIRQASVTLEGRAERAMTDGEGRWRLRVPRPGTYAVIVETEGRTARHEIDVPIASYALTLTETPSTSRKLARSRKGGEAE